MNDVRGMDPKQMKAIILPLEIGLQKIPVQKPIIKACFLDRELNFHLDAFQGYCKNFNTSYKGFDFLRCKAGITNFLNFFTENKNKFQHYSVEIQYFLDTFMSSGFLSSIRDIIQMREEPLYDPTVYFCSLLLECDDRFAPYLANYDIVPCLANSLARIETDDQRVFQNTVNLFLSLLKYHQSVDEKYEDVLEHFDTIFDRLDEFKIETKLRARIIYTLVAYGAESISELYPTFVIHLMTFLEPSSIYYTAATFAQMLFKVHEFFTVLYDNPILSTFFDCYNQNHPDDATLTILMLVRALLVSSGPDKKVQCLNFLNYDDLRYSLNSSNSSVATFALKLVLHAFPEALDPTIAACGQFFRLLDSIIMNMRISQNEQIETAIQVLILLARYKCADLIRFVNNDFHETCISILKSDIRDQQEGILALYEEIYSNKESSRQVTARFFMDVLDEGGDDILRQLKRSKDREFGNYVRDVYTKINDLQKIYRRQ